MHAPHPADDRALTAATIDGSLDVIQSVFRQVRPLVLKHAGKIEHTAKQDGTPVTDIDIEVEKTLQAELARHFPDLPVFGEETGYKSDDLPAACWLIDPIDGTKSFIENVPTFTSMGVLIQHGEAIAAVVYNPSLDTMYVAQKDKGAYKNNVRLDLTTMPLSRVAFCKEALIDPLNELLRSTGVGCEVAPTGAGSAFSLVAEGSVAARFNLPGGGHVHDYAPGALLVREAGGVVVPVMDENYTIQTRSFVACHPQLETIVRRQLPRLRELEESLVQLR